MYELHAPLPTLGACLSLLPAGKTALAACIPPMEGGGEIKWLDARVIESFHVRDHPILRQLQKGQRAPQWRAFRGEGPLQHRALRTADECFAGYVTGALGRGGITPRASPRGTSHRHIGMRGRGHLSTGAKSWGFARAYGHSGGEYLVGSRVGVQACVQRRSTGRPVPRMCPLAQRVGGGAVEDRHQLVAHGRDDLHA